MDKKKNFTRELVAPCGMNCNICSGFLAMRYNLKDQGIRISCCIGCRPRNKQCAFLKKQCEYLRNQTIQFCFECPEYPCENLRHIDTRYRTFFRMSILQNLQDIQKKGIDTFLREQEAKWGCPICGGTVCCHNGLCFQCDGERLKTKKKMYRWEDD